MGDVLGLERTLNPPAGPVASRAQTGQPRWPIYPMYRGQPHGWTGLGRANAAAESGSRARMPSAAAADSSPIRPSSAAREASEDELSSTPRGRLETGIPLRAPFLMGELSPIEPSPLGPRWEGSSPQSGDSGAARTSSEGRLSWPGTLELILREVQELIRG